MFSGDAREETNCRKMNKVKRTPKIALLPIKKETKCCERVRKSVRPRFQCQVTYMYVLKVIIVEHQSVADDMDRAG